MLGQVTLSGRPMGLKIMASIIFYWKFHGAITNLFVVVNAVVFFGSRGPTWLHSSTATIVPVVCYSRRHCVTRIQSKRTNKLHWQPASADCTTLSEDYIWPSRFLCGRPDGLELTTDRVS